MKEIKFLEVGDLVTEFGADYVITDVNRTGQSGRMKCINASPYIKGDFFEVYFDVCDLVKMSRRTIAQVSKKLADVALAIRKRQSLNE